MKFKKTYYALFVVCSAVLLLTAPSAQGQDITASIGAEWTTGDYGGGDNSDVFYVPVSVGYADDDWFFKASLPYLDIKGPGLFLGDNIPLVRRRDTPVRGAEESVSGFGDLSLSAGRTFELSQDGNTRFDLMGRVKLATANDDKNLSSGKMDYSISGSLTHDMNAWSIFTDFGYRITGDPDGLPLKDTPFGAVGTSYLMDNGTNIGLAYDYSGAATIGTNDSHELSSWVSFKIGKKQRLQVYGVKGLSNGGPDYGVGTRLSFRI